MRQVLGGALVVVFCVILVAAYRFGPQPQHEHFSVLFVAANGSVEKITRGLDALYQEAPDFASRFDVRVLAPSNSFADAELPAHDILIVESMDGRWVSSLTQRLQQSQAEHRLALGASGLHDDPQLLERLGFNRDDSVEAYWENSAPGEIASLFKYYAARYLGVQDLAVASPRPNLSQGFISFQPDGVELMAEWGDWQALHGDDPRPRVGILEYASRARAEGLALSRAVAAELDRRGYLAVPLFAERATPAVVSLLFNEDGSARIESLISFHHKFFEEASAQTLESLDIPVINAISVAGRTVDEWRDSIQGLTSSEIARQLAIPELAGLAPSMVVGAVDNALSDITLVPIPDRVERAAARAIRYAELRSKPLAEHKVAILYWNYPPGKQNVGASYLNVVRSIPALLRRMQTHGYSVTDLPELPAPEDESDAEDPLSTLIVERGRNIGHYAPGELQVLIDGGAVESISMAQYKAWFDELPPRFRADVIDMWGQPEDADIMVSEIDGEKHIILPVLRFGQVIIMPQPDRARMQNLDALYQSQELPPHHQYVAAYMWLQHEYRADAIIHTGTHGTHEWLSGKESGLAGDDPGEVLAGDMAIIYPYIVDDVGEGIVAKRRGMSTIVDHLTPALGRGDISPELGRLRGHLESWRLARNTDPDSAEASAAMIEQEVEDRGLVLDLQDRGWADDAPADRATRFSVLEDYLTQVEGQTIPLGLHTLGVELTDDRLQRFTDSIAEANGEDMWQTANDRLRASVESEIDGIFTGLAGRYVRPGPGNDPVRNIDAIPTGKNFMTFDPRAIPMASADALGREMAESLIATHVEAHGEAPQKIALQLWGVESLRHQGVQEAQGLALLGVRPVRANNGRIASLELIPREELGRPRVDVVFHATSLYRDTFPMLFDLIDEAVQLAASSPEDDNPVRRHGEALEQELLAMGMSANQARVQSFAEPSGKHDSKIHAMTHASGSWDAEQQVAETYIRRMGHGYGGGNWGTSAEHAFRAALKDTDMILHSRASSLYATLDNDDYFSYGGSIALGVRQANGGGASPDFYVTDLRKVGDERHEPLERFMGQELRSRYLNPEFAREMMAEGYAGARDIWKATDYLWGWAVVYPEAVDDAKWQEMYDVWLNDRYELDMDAYFEEHSPYARQGIAARMLETVRKGYWDAPEETLAHLTRIYVDSLVDHGPSCDHLTCDNPELQVFVQEVVQSGVGVDAADLETAMASIEQATQSSIEDALAQRIEDRVRWHQPPPADDAAAQANDEDSSSEALEQVAGYQLEEEITQTTANSEPSVLSSPLQFLQLGLLLLLLGSMLAGMRSGLRRNEIPYNF